MPVVLTLDAEGGDNAPAEIVAGALLAASPTLRVLLVGRPEVVETASRGRRPQQCGDRAERVGHQLAYGAGRGRQEHAGLVHRRGGPDGRRRPLSGVRLGGQHRGHAGGGPAGRQGAWSGIRRPAIVTTLPGLKGPVVFLDAGANADCRPEHLLEFGVLGTAFARTVLGMPEPRVGLLNIGEEESKGSELAQAAYELLKASGLNFVGNVEGRDLLRNTADVVVTDGFTGNVALKLLEGCSSILFARVKEAATSGARAKAGGVLLRPALRGLRAGFDPEEYGGTYLLGVRGLVVICHGNSTRKAIANALRFGADALRKGVLTGVDAEVAAILGRGDAAAS